MQKGVCGTTAPDTFSETLNKLSGNGNNNMEGGLGV